MKQLCLRDYGTEAAVRMIKTRSTALLAFRGEPRTKLVVSWKQYRGLNSGRRYASFISRQLPIACNTSRTVLQATGSLVRALEQGNRCTASDSFTLLAEAWHYFVADSSMYQRCPTLVVNYFRVLPVHFRYNFGALLVRF